jgi:hypothetical protein
LREKPLGLRYSLIHQAFYLLFKEATFFLKRVDVLLVAPFGVLGFLGTI